MIVFVIVFVIMIVFVTTTALMLMPPSSPFPLLQAVLAAGVTCVG